MIKQSILFVTSRVPYPPIGGDRIRMFKLLEILSKDFHVTLICLGSVGVADESALKSATGIEHLHVIPHSKIKSWFGAIKALFTGLPLQVGYYKSERLKQEVGKVVSGVDLCIFHLIRTSLAWSNASRVPAILEMCDAISANLEQTKNEGAVLSPWRLISLIEAPRVKRFEQNEIARFDLISLHTDKDARKLGVAPDKLLVSSQGADTADLVYLDPIYRTGRNVAFIGRMDFFPNWYGVEWFSKEVLPLLAPDIKLKVIGACSDRIKNKLIKNSRVVVTGRVDSLTDASADCFVAIAPLKVATGIQNKVLEYFAMGLPTILTSTVSSGLLAESNGGYLVANDAKEWAASIESIAENKNLARSIALLALVYVRQHHSWDKIGKDYKNKIITLASGSG